MSKVGKVPVTIPSGVTVTVGDESITVKGPKGEQTLPTHPSVSVVVNDNQVVFQPNDQDKVARAMFGTMRALVANMITGVSDGYSKRLEIQGVGYRAQLQGTKLVLNIGFCHSVDIEAPEGIEFKVPDPTHIEVSGSSKQLVGQTAAVIRAVRKPEPYKGKGIRYEGEQVRRKAGKSGK
ncbi:MAG: 50S ribosomal protein L6 [Planctomycetota bacterium]|nr:MAG: 50S ribosomal protein L6 [Planctomycetota bacterium]